MTTMVSTKKGVWIGSICLVILVFQNSLFLYATHEGRVPDENGNLYYAPTMVVLVEFIKAMISFIILFSIQYKSVTNLTNSGEYSLLHPTTLEDGKEAEESKDIEAALVSSPSSVIRAVFSNIANLIFVKSAWKLCIPATLYVVQTNLAVIGAQNLDSTTFLVASQLKFATTALCFSVMLNRVIGLKRWLSLGALALGILLVQIAGQIPTLKSTAAASERSPVIGMLSIIAACFISGFASIYIERILKDASNNLWATNIQLGTFSLLPAALPCIIDAMRNGFLHPFAYFGFWAWSTVAANVMGGLVVALIMKYADNIQKSLAISASIVLTFVLTVAVGKAEASPMAVIGSALVIISIIAYSRYPVKEASNNETQWQHADEPLSLNKLAMEPLLSTKVISDNDSRFAIEDESNSSSSSISSYTPSSPASSHSSAHVHA